MYGNEIYRGDQKASRDFQWHTTHFSPLMFSHVVGNDIVHVYGRVATSCLILNIRESLEIFVTRHVQGIFLYSSVHTSCTLFQNSPFFCV